MQALPFIAMGATAGGGLMSAIGQIRQGQAAAKIAEANAQLSTQDAERRQEAAKVDSLKLSREMQRTVGRQVALYGAAGVDIGSGSPLDVIGRTVEEYATDIGFTGIRADQETRRGEIEAKILRYQGSQARSAGYWGAGSTILTSFGKAVSMYPGLYPGSTGKGE